MLKADTVAQQNSKMPTTQPMSLSICIPPRNGGMLAQIGVDFRASVGVWIKSPHGTCASHLLPSRREPAGAARRRPVVRTTAAPTRDLGRSILLNAIDPASRSQERNDARA